MPQTIKAVVKNRFDTFANLTAVNDIPYEGEIVFESDTLRFKVGDGTTAYNSLSYWDDDDNLPIPIDISTANQEVTFPAHTGRKIERTYFWTGGDGTYKFTIIDPATSLALEYEGEGGGHIKVVSTGSTCKVVEYEDSYYDLPDSWIKHLDGALEVTGMRIATAATSFQYPLSHAFIDTNYYATTSQKPSGSSSGVHQAWASTTTEIAVQNTVVGNETFFRAIGRWKA